VTTTVREPRTRTQVGVSRPRRDAAEKLRGQAQFVGDMLVPRMLYGKVLRSTIAHGRIVSIDTTAAEKIPGVVCVLTGADLSDIDPYYGHAIKDRPIIAIDKVRFHGEQVAAVAAETPAAAAAAVGAGRTSRGAPGGRSSRLVMVRPSSPGPPARSVRTRDGS